MQLAVKWLSAFGQVKHLAM